MTRARLCACFLSLTLYTIVFIAVILFVPGLPPTSVRFESFRNAPSLVFEENEILDNAEILVGPSGGFAGPESIAVRGDDIFTGVIGGRILKINKHGTVSTVTEIEQDCRHALWNEGIKCGRPLGMRFDSNGKLFVADAYFGLYKIDVDTGKTDHIVSTEIEIDGKRPLFPDDLDLGSNGEIYWSDASTAGNMQNSLIEYLGTGSGRVIKYDPVTKTNTVLMENLHFPNGIQLSPNEDFLLVAESMRLRVLRYFLKGERQGERDIFVDGLPGIPDNIRPNGRGGYYIALAVTRDADHPLPTDNFSHLPLVRKLILRIYGIIDLFLSYINRLIPSSPEMHFLRTYVSHMGPLGDPSNYPNKVTIVDVSGDGKVIKTLQTKKSEMRTVTEARVGKAYTYFASFMEPKIWRIKNKYMIPK